MNEYNIKTPIRLIVLLSLILLAPYKSGINKRVYDPEANYQVLKKINRSDIRTMDNIFIVYDKNFKVDFYVTSRDEPIFIKNLDKIIYLENYEDHLGSIIEVFYSPYVIFIKNNKTFYYKYGRINEVSIKDYASFIDKELYSNSIYRKKVEPFILQLQTPKEFYNNFKEYFFPYYLGEYEVK